MNRIERRDRFVAPAPTARPAAVPPRPSAPASPGRDELERPLGSGPFGASPAAVGGPPEPAAALPSPVSIDASPPPRPAPAAATDHFDHDRLVQALTPFPELAARPRVARLRWKEASPALLAPSTARLRGRLASVTSSLGRAREALWTHDERNARVRYGVELAGESLGRLATHVGSVHETLQRRLVAGGTRLLSAVAEAREGLQAIRHEAESAGQALGEVVGRAETSGVREALGETAVLQGSAQAAEGELQLLGGRAALLQEMEAGSVFFAHEPMAPSSADFDAEDLALLGTALPQPPPQTLWNENMVNLVSAEGRRQGGLTEEQAARHAELARQATGGMPNPLALGAADLAALLKKSGLAPGRVDPNQLRSASRYLAEAATLADQQERLRKALDNFHVLDRIGLPRMPREQLMGQLDTHAKVPGAATARLGDADLRAKFDEIALTLNAGGELRTRVGGHNLTLKVDEGGRLEQSSCKKPGLFSRIGSALGRVVPVALTALSFLPATAPFARIAQGAISLVRAIRNRSALGMAMAGVSLIGAGTAAAGRTFAQGAASVLGRVESLANAASRALQGVSSLRQGTLVGGLANLGGAVADGLAGFSGSLKAGVQSFADGLGRVSARLTTAAIGISAVDSYRAASRAVSEAKTALARATASGNPQLVAAAKKRLDEARRGQRSALLGGAASAAAMAADVVGDRRLRPSGDQNFPPPRSVVEAQLRLASRGLGVARDVAAKDFVAAGVDALGAAAAHQATRRDLDPNAFHPLNGAANMADAALWYHRAGSAEHTVSQAVKEAETALHTARRSGQPEAIAAAQANLDRARRGAEGALVSAIAARDSLVKTAESIREQHDVAKERARAVDAQRNGLARARDLLRFMDDPQASPEERKAAAARFLRLAAAGAAYEQALRSGNSRAIKAAREAFVAAQSRVEPYGAEGTRATEGLIGFPPDKTKATGTAVKPPVKAPAKPPLVEPPRPEPAPPPKAQPPAPKVPPTADEPSKAPSGPPPPTRATTAASLGNEAPTSQWQFRADSIRPIEGNTFRGALWYAIDQKDLGPAIRMDPSDHKLTSSFGNRPLAVEYRLHLQRLIAESRWREAMATEIRDVRRVAGSRYDQAIREMLDYARALGVLAKR